MHVKTCILALARSTRPRYLLPLLLLSGLYFSTCTPHAPPVISIWYGDEQRFGLPGNSQKYINVLGHISSKTSLQATFYCINGGRNIPFQLGSDLHRLAKSGDFNIEFLRDLLSVGQNSLVITAIDSTGQSAQKKVTLHYREGHAWPLPYTLRWDTVTNIQEVVQVLDGKWEITPDGIRIREPYYDRTLAFGDSTWCDYEVTAEVKFHTFMNPSKGAPSYNVTHAALALRWPGFDVDAHQPHRKWYPLGATCEFRLTAGKDRCRFRILAGGPLKNDQPETSHEILLEKWYTMKARVESLEMGASCYKAKLWPSDLPEPEGWDISFVKAPEEVFSGCALAIAHHSEVTFGVIQAAPIN